MRYSSLPDFKQHFFGQAKRPSLAKLRRMCAARALPCIQLGKDWFIDVPAFEARANPLLAKILRHESGAS